MVAAINANNAGVGTATIGGTSRLILTGANADLNVNGNTNITAPLTFGASSAASIDAGFTLNATNTRDLRRWLDFWVGNVLPRYD